MSEESRVYIEKEGKVFRWGQDAYFKTWNGLKETVSVTRVKAFALPLAVILSVLTFFFSGDRDATDTRGKEMDVPTVSQDVPTIAAPIYDGRESVNQIRAPRVATGAMGRIKVFNLRHLSEIPVGSEAKAILESGATDGIVKAKLVSALMVDGDPILPENAILFGRGKSSEERLFVEFQKAVFPGGESFAIRGQAFDIGDKILGLKGSVVGRRTKKMGMAVGFGVLGGMADALQETSGSSFFGYQKRSVRDAALAGASKAALDQSQAYMEEMKNSPNIIEVKKGTEFYLIIDEPKRKDE